MGKKRRSLPPRQGIKKREFTLREKRKTLVSLQKSKKRAITALLDAKGTD